MVLDGGQDPAPHQGSVGQERGCGSGHPLSTTPSGGEQSPGVDVAGLTWGARGQVGGQDPSGEGLSGYNNKAGDSTGAVGGLGGGEAPRGERGSVSVSTAEQPSAFVFIHMVSVRWEGW